MLADLEWASATAIATSVAEGDVSAVDVAGHFLSRIAAIDETLRAFSHLDPNQVLADAAALDGEIARGVVPGPFCGVPFAIKDITPVAGVPATGGFLPLKDNIPAEDADLVRRLRAAGGIFLGKTNQAEVGYCGVTDNHMIGPTRNPWNLDRISGGSSGGAAAAVAAGLAPIAEGGDGAGSVRIPAAICGIVGMKPSIGVVPGHRPGQRFVGDWGFHGPMTRNVADAARMLEVMSGQSSQDPFSLPQRFSSAEVFSGDLRGLRIAWSHDLGLGRVDPEIAGICAQAASVFKDLGCEVTEAAPAWQDDPETIMWEGIWAPAYAAFAHQFDLDALAGQVDEQLIRVIREGSALTGHQISKAQLGRSRMWNVCRDLMRDYDLLISPTLADQTFRVGEFCPPELKDAPLRSQILGWLLTYPFNLLGLPAISIPAGFTRDGMPVGLQIAGGMHRDATVLRAALHFETATHWHKRRPQMGWTDQSQ